MRSWNAIRAQFVDEGKTLPEIARESGLSYGTLSKRAVRENWSEERSRRMAEETEARIARVCRELLERLEQSLRETEGLETKELKTVTGALRELSELCGGREKSAGAQSVTVRFVGEAEELSR